MDSKSTASEADLVVLERMLRRACEPVLYTRPGGCGTRSIWSSMRARGAEAENGSRKRVCWVADTIVGGTALPLGRTGQKSRRIAYVTGLFPNLRPTIGEEVPVTERRIAVVSCVHSFAGLKKSSMREIEHKSILASLRCVTDCVIR